MGFAAVDLLVSPAKRTEHLEGSDQPEGQSSLLAPRPLAYDTIDATLSQG